MPKCRRANSVVLIAEPSGKHVSEGDGVKEAPWSKLRHGGKLRGPKTYHRTRWRCVHAQDWCNVRNHSTVPLLCALCPVLSCSLCAALPNPQQRTMSSVAFFTPTANESSESLKNMTRTRSEASPTASGGEPRCKETTTPLSELEFRTVQRVLTGRLQLRPSTDMVMLPSSVRTRPTAVGRLSLGIPVVTSEPLSLKQQALHGHTTPRSWIAGRMTIAFAGTPSFTSASQSRTVGPSTAPRTTHSAFSAANDKPVVNTSAVAQGPSTTPSPRSSCAAAGTNRCGQGAV